MASARSSALSVRGPEAERRRPLSPAQRRRFPVTVRPRAPLAARPVRRTMTANDILFGRCCLQTTLRAIVKRPRTVAAESHSDLVNAAGAKGASRSIRQIAGRPRNVNDDPPEAKRIRIAMISQGGSRRIRQVVHVKQGSKGNPFRFIIRYGRERESGDEAAAQRGSPNSWNRGLGFRVSRTGAVVVATSLPGGGSLCCHSSRTTHHSRLRISLQAPVRDGSGRPWPRPGTWPPPRSRVSPPDRPTPIAP